MQDKMEAMAYDVKFCRCRGVVLRLNEQSLKNYKFHKF